MRDCDEQNGGRVDYRRELRALGIPNYLRRWYLVPRRLPPLNLGYSLNGAVVAEERGFVNEA